MQGGLFGGIFGGGEAQGVARDGFEVGIGGLGNVGVVAEADEGHGFIVI